MACHVAGQLSLQKKDAATYAKWLPLFVNTLVIGARDKNSNVCAACEEALVTLLHIDVPGFKDTETYTVSLLFITKANIGNEYVAVVFDIYCVIFNSGN